MRRLRALRPLRFLDGAHVGEGDIVLEVDPWRLSREALRLWTHRRRNDRDVTANIDGKARFLVLGEHVERVD